MTFRFTDTNIYPLPGTNGLYMHLASISSGLREFLYFKNTKTNQTWIEEITSGSLQRIEEETLWSDLYAFLEARHSYRSQACTYVLEQDYFL